VKVQTLFFAEGILPAGIRNVQGKMTLLYSYPNFVYFYWKSNGLFKKNARSINYRYFINKLHLTFNYKAIYYGIINEEVYAICIHCYFRTRDYRQIYHKLPVQTSSIS